MNFNNKNKKNPVLTFKISGRFAHFKKFYSNSSSLSYNIPPRTVLTGMLASILEIRRDEYYDLFNPNDCKISVSIKNPVKKQLEVLNYLMKASKGHTNIPVELVLPIDEKLLYQIYVIHSDENIIEKLYSKLNTNNLGYGIYLGQRQFRANLESVQLLEGTIKTNCETAIETVTWKENLSELNMDANLELEELTIVDNYTKATGRFPNKMITILNPIKGQLKGKFKEILSLPNEDIAFFVPIANS